MKILKGNIVKCDCGKFLQYDENDIIEIEKSYTVQTYGGDTYITKLITCPNCKRKIELL